MAGLGNEEKYNVVQLNEPFFSFSLYSQGICMLKPIKYSILIRKYLISKQMKKKQVKVF